MADLALLLYGEDRPAARPAIPRRIERLAEAGRQIEHASGVLPWRAYRRGRVPSTWRTDPAFCAAVAQWQLLAIVSPARQPQPGDLGDLCPMRSPRRGARDSRPGSGSIGLASRSRPGARASCWRERSASGPGSRRPRPASPPSDYRSARIGESLLRSAHPPPTRRATSARSAVARTHGRLIRAPSS